ncbi:transposase [Gluconacetobacter sp. 1b LMG 1731]|uniref:Transposase n=1 Tax=Gluconacetobacter dulcium TaxID=2729096 RepID=A0A7W4IN47_9PROT|nr:transposase [Gluconacetobacter dulcium]MBB2195046.1 transposase [Gluconacetobacter dulcium]MBB2197691.1 transposase [Gluconacetobacter dulcium]
MPAIAKWIGHYNSRRPHSALAGRTPDEAYHGFAPTPLPGLTPATVSVSNNEKLAA